MVEWTARGVIATTEKHTFFKVSEDGEHSRFVDVVKRTPDLNF